MKLRVTIEGETFDVEIGDLSARPIQAMVDGETFEIWPEEGAASTAAPLAAAPVAVPLPPVANAAAAPAANSARAIQAPIPGVILSISAKPGDTVAFGQEVCVLEAMKMKNAIRASRAGTIAAVRVAVGDQVRHGQVLMDFTE